ncbi:MAG: hypothetical protein RR843_10215 [Clostridia bacterium]
MQKPTRAGFIQRFPSSGKGGAHCRDWEIRLRQERVSLPAGAFANGTAAEAPVDLKDGYIILTLKKRLRQCREV